MHQPFALAKIQPPLPRANVVPREPLIRRLCAAVREARLTLLCAPAGFGKTVALTQTIHAVGARGTRVAWLSADEDDQAQRFVACLCAALEPFDLPWRLAPEALVAAAGEGRARRSQVADALVNALAGSEEGGLLVDDDLHRIDDPAVPELLELVLERLPAQWSVAIGTRVEPDLPLPRWRAGGELAEFRQDDLRFDAEAVAALVAASPSAAPLSAGELMRRTQGWPAGLRLSLQTAAAAGAVSRGSSGAAQRHLFDYLATEVLDDMPAELRDFLLRCAVLPELTVARCIAVTGDVHAAERLDEIERRGLFVTVLDSEETTLRLHDLFRDFLEDRLRRERPGEWGELLQRAAAQEEDVARRVNLLVRAGAWEQAQAALVGAVPALLLAGAPAQVARLVEQFPREVQERSAPLAFARGLCAWPRFEWVTMQRAMERAARGFDAAGHTALALQAGTFETVALMALGRLDEAGRRLDALRARPLDRDTHALAELMMYWRTGASGPADGPAAHLQRMVELLEAGPDRGRAPAAQWLRCAPHFMFIGRPGLRAPMERFVRAALEVAGEHHSPLRAAAHVLQAWLLLWQGRLEEAAPLMATVDEDDRWLGHPRGLRIPILAFRAAWGLLHDDRDTAREAAQAMVDDVDADPERRATWRGVYLYNLGRVSSAVGDRAGLDEALALLAQTPAHLEWPHMRPARLAVRALAALEDGRLGEARELLEAAAVDSAEVDTLSLDATVRVTLARVHLRRGDARAAWQVLSPLIARARASGEPVIVLFTGRRACMEIAEVRPPAGFEADHAWLVSHCALWDGLAREPLGTRARATRPADSPLSERELEVLERMAVGDSNKAIARALDLSPHTVKRHVANILAKLAVESRGQAAAWYRDRFPVAQPGRV